MARMDRLGYIAQACLVSSALALPQTRTWQAQGHPFTSTGALTSQPSACLPDVTATLKTADTTSRDFNHIASVTIPLH